MLTVQAVLWFVVLEVLGVLWFVAALPLFPGYRDRGFGLSKTGGLLLLVLLPWLLSPARLIPFTAATGRVLLGLAVVAGLAGLWSRRAQVRLLLAAQWRLLLAEEVLFLSILAFFTLLRLCAPQIDGSEKPMDFALLNALIRAPQMPPADPWLSGFPVSYYYFGYVPWALLAKILHVPSGVAYNLAIAVLPAQAAAGACSVGLKLGRQNATGFVSALWLTFAGNLAGSAHLFAAGWRHYDVWAPTRVIANTINEFPFFSFFWADLHPHVLAMPNQVLLVGLLVSVVSIKGRPLTRLLLWGAAGIAAGVGVVTSTWDLVPAALLIGSVMILDLHGRTPAAVLGSAAAMLTCALVVAGPFLAASDLPLVRVGLAASGSRLGEFLLVQGGWLAPVALVLVCRAGRLTWRPTALLLGAVLGTLAVSGSVVLALLLGMSVVSICLLVVRRDGVLWMPVCAALVLLALSEAVFVDDVYGPGLERLNSVFKFHLQACVLLGISSGPLIGRLLRLARSRTSARVLAACAVGLLAVALLAYPTAASARRLESSPPGWTLDGTDYLRGLHPGDFAVVGFLNQHVSGQPVIVEASGQAYEYAGRISSNTGLPTMVGWAQHERLWRRGQSAGQEIDRREAAVRQLYEGDSATALGIAREYGVAFVVLGDVERRKYDVRDPSKFEQFGDRVLSESGTSLYRLR